jgi:tetratricopeptide (TPR) repeat protein
VAELHHIVPALVYLYSTAAEIQIANRNWDRAEEYLNPGLAIAETLNHQERRAGYMANMAEVSWGRGHRDAAIEQLARAAQMVDDIGVRYASARHHLRLAELRSEYGNRAEAAAHLQRATQIAHEGSFGSLLAQAEALKTKIRAETES